MLATARRLLLPASLLAAAVLLRASGWSDRIDAGDLRLAARGAIIVAFALAWRFRSARSGWSALLLAAALEAPGRAAAPQVAGAVAALLVPAGLAVCTWLPDRPLASRGGLAGMAFLGALVLLVGLADPAASSLPAGVRTALTTVADPSRRVQVLAAALLLALAGAAVGLLRSRDPVGAGLLVATGAAILAQRTPDDGTLFLGAAALALAAAVADRGFRLAHEDALTGLPSRRALEARLRELGGTYAIAMVDLDRFKQLNDRHGHAAGDQALRWVARRLAAVGGGGEVFRYGGEEFAIVFPRSTVSAARPHLESLRQGISADRFVVRGPQRPARKPRRARAAPASRGARVTVSIGVAGSTAERRLPREVLAAADKALYRAKRAGRNRVTSGR